MQFQTLETFSQLGGKGAQLHKMKQANGFAIFLYKQVTIINYQMEIKGRK